MLNDDFTPMEFVTMLLVEHFNKTVDDAMILTGIIHSVGKATIDVFTYEIAETKINIVSITSRNNGYPLMAVMEAVD